METNYDLQLNRFCVIMSKHEAKRPTRLYRVGLFFC